MVSATKQTETIRRRKRATNGKANTRAKTGTPKFPIHQEGTLAVKVAAAKPATK